MEPRSVLHDDESPKLKSSEATNFRQLVRSLHYLTTIWPDIAYSVSKISRFLCNPRKNHWVMLQPICRYLSGTSFASIHISRIYDLRLKAFSDADWSGDSLDRWSHGGYLIYLGNNLITWKFGKQPSISRSSTEVEYRSLADVDVELNWTKSIVREMGIYLESPLRLACDNLGENYLARNPIYTSWKSKACRNLLPLCLRTYHYRVLNCGAYTFRRSVDRHSYKGPSNDSFHQHQKQTHLWHPDEFAGGCQ